MTIHVLHAGDGYLYLIRSVAAHDGRLTPGSSLAAYYLASGQPPGRWAGQEAQQLGVAGVVTEEQMRALFGEGLHPDAEAIQRALRMSGVSEEAALRATRLGRRFPQYRRTEGIVPLARRAYAAREQALGRRLTGEEKLAVRQEAAREVFASRKGRPPLDPVELEALGEDTSRREAVAGYDLTFTPVKSVAVLWGLGSERTRQQIFEAHEAAVADALDWVESHAALTRTGNHGQAQIDTQGLIVARFHHWDSRAGDPDLHTHAAVSNKVQGLDGKWRSLDGRVLFAAAVSVSERYNTRIEDELRTRLGVEFTERSGARDGRRPVREIAGIPQALLEAFSKRRSRIEQQYQDLLRDYRDRHGREPAGTTRHALYQQATLSNRPDKQHGRSLQEMLTTWRAEAARILDTPEVTATVENMVAATSHDGGTADLDGLAEQLLTTLSTSRATWNIHHVRAEAHRQTRSIPTDDRDRLVEAVVAQATDPARIVEIAMPRPVVEPEELRRADGESVFVEHGSALYTTTQILDAEQRIVDAGRDDTGRLLDQATVRAAIDRAARDGRELNTGQRGLIRGFCCSGRVVQLGLAPAGAGKTTAMRVVTHAWQSSGAPVVALAPSAAAAAVLGEELGTPADTLAKFDHDHPTIAPGTLIVVDEAGMAGTLVLDRLVTRAREAGAVVRLLGDDQQLAAVEAGGVLRHLAHEVGAIRMGEIVRFTDPAEAAATLQVRQGDPAAVDFYLDHDRVLAGTDATMPEVAYTRWLADLRDGQDSLLLASSGQMVTDLNARARADLIVAGQVAVDGVALRDGTAAGVGDRVTTRRNERRLIVNGGRDWVKNGDGWRVLATHPDGSLAVEHRTHRGRTVLPADYVAAQVELDYARTIRRAQGLTVDRAHLVVTPGLCREEFYVGVSRAREGTWLYVASMIDDEPDHRPDMAGATRDVLAGIIQRSGVEPAAHDAIHQTQVAAGDLRRMAVEYEYALGVHVGDRYRDVAETVHPGITEDPAWPSVAQRLHLAEAAGWEIPDILRQADGMRDYHDARSATSVLVFRLDRLLTYANHQTDREPVPAWLAAAPPSPATAPWDAYLPARYAEMEQRITILAAEATAEPAAWLDGIGRGAGRGEAIRQTVTYRAVYAVTTDEPLGPCPDRRGRQYDAWTATRAAIQASHHHQPADVSSPVARILAAFDNHGRTTGDDRPADTRTGPTRSLS